MRISITPFALAAALAGCAATAPPPVYAPAPVVAYSGPYDVESQRIAILNEINEIDTLLNYDGSLVAPSIGFNRAFTDFAALNRRKAQLKAALRQLEARPAVL